MDSDKTAGQVYNVGGNTGISIEDLAKRVVERTGSKSEIHYLPYEQVYGTGYEDMRHRKPCLEKVSAAIGFEPKVDLDAMLDIIIEDTKKRMPV